MQPGVWQRITKALLNCRYIPVFHYKSSEKRIKSRWFIGGYKAVKKVGKKRGSKENPDWAEEPWPVPARQRCWGLDAVAELQKSWACCPGSAVGSSVPDELVLQRICLEGAELRKLWGGSCWALPRFGARCCSEVPRQGGSCVPMPARAAFLSLCGSPVQFHQLLLLLNRNSESGSAAGLGLLSWLHWKTSNLFFDQVILRAVLLVLLGLTHVKTHFWSLELKHASLKIRFLNFPNFSSSIYSIN